jgi:hypothetical protein
MFVHNPSQPYTLYPKVHIRVSMFPLYLGFHQILSPSGAGSQGFTGMAECK